MKINRNGTDHLDGQISVVTGAGRGIGREYALMLAAHGAKVVVNYRSHREQADEVVQQIRQLGSQAVAIQADVADQAAVAIDHVLCEI